ncbi:MAG: DUF4249 domain-containing protein [Bacteroidia bacterium]|nr:DUF4249 domain-containing protein [Bacteroidia bacterium]
MRFIFFYIIFLMTGGLLSCVEPFDPEITNYENALVVEGYVAEGKTPARVILSRTFAFDQDTAEYINGATVRMRDDQGNEYRLLSKGKGIYESDTNAVQGIPGRSYQLLIETADSKSYESSWELMKKSGEIEAINPRFETFVTGFDTLNGMQVYLNTSGLDGNGRFYRWELEETWMFRVPYPARGYWNTTTQQPVFVEPDSMHRTCYKHLKPADILIATTEGFSEDKLTDFPLIYVSTQTDRLSLKYSLLIRQHTLSAEAYEYWRATKEINQELGTLFDPVPADITGNIRNIDDPDEPVIGYFSADGFTQKRIFIDRIDVPPVNIPTGFETCPYIIFVDPADVQRYVLAGNAWVGAVTDFFGNIIGYTGSTKKCSDCTQQGSFVKPDFWP